MNWFKVGGYAAVALICGALVWSYTSRGAKIAELEKSLAMAVSDEKKAVAEKDTIKAEYDRAMQERNQALARERKARQREREILNVDPSMDGACAPVLCPPHP